MAIGLPSAGDQTALVMRPTSRSPAASVQPRTGTVSAEPRLAEDLRSRGFQVFGGH